MSLTQEQLRALRNAGAVAATFRLDYSTDAAGNDYMARRFLGIVLQKHGITAYRSDNGDWYTPLENIPTLHAETRTNGGSLTVTGYLDAYLRPVAMPEPQPTPQPRDNHWKTIGFGALIAAGIYAAYRFGR